MIYISHILGDVIELADDIAVLRDGELVAAGPKADFNIARMITLMVGRPIEQLYPPRALRAAAARPSFDARPRRDRHHQGRDLQPA